MSSRAVPRPIEGFSLVEVLIALAIIGVAFGALGLIQVTNLRATGNARLVSEVKEAANFVLERELGNVLVTETEICLTQPEVCAGLEELRYFAFNDYYWSCPTVLAPRSGIQTRYKTLACAGVETVVTGSGQDVSVSYAIAGLSGVEGQGVLSISVTATHLRREGLSVSIGDRVTCFDVYPSPTVDTPAPCPPPEGGGRD